MNQNNKLDYFVGVFFAILTALLSVAFALLLQQFIDGIGQPMEILFKHIFVSVIFVVTFIVCGFLSNLFQQRYTRKATTNIRNHVMNSILSKSSREITKGSQGQYLSLLSNDITTLEQKYIQASIMIIVQTVMCVTGIAVMIYLNWVMTLLVLISTTLPLIFSSIYGVKLKRCQDVVSNQNSQYVGLVKDIFGGSFVIKSFRVEKRIEALSAESVDLLEGAKEKHRRVFANMQVLVQSTTFLIVFLIFIFGGYLVKNGLFTIGGLMAFLQLLNNVTGPLNQISDNLSNVKGSEAILAAIEEIQKTENNYEGKIDKKHFEDEICLDDVSFSYDTQSDHVLNHISCTFQKGKSYAIVGESGCGKSTLLKMINGFFTEYEGKVLMDGVEVKELSEDSIGTIFGNIQQDTFVFNTTIHNNITLFEDWPSDEVEKVIHSSGLDKVLEERGVNAVCGEMGSNLSGGECQRIAIARALLRNREILIMDEATSALDIENSSFVEQEFLKMEGITKIVVTHKLNPSLLNNYDEILVMKNGEICERGNCQELIRENGIFARLCEMAN